MRDAGCCAECRLPSCGGEIGGHGKHCHDQESYDAALRSTWLDMIESGIRQCNVL